MNDDPAPPPLQPESAFSRQVASKAARKLKVQRAGQTGVWLGLGMTGLIGWSVVVPTVLGAMLGLWLDRHHPGGRSWTLALLVAGLAVGCANAWYWVSQQDRAIRNEARNGDE